MPVSGQDWNKMKSGVNFHLTKRKRMGFKTCVLKIVSSQETFWSLHTSLSLYLWLYSPFLGLGLFFSFLVFYTDGRTFWTGKQPVARPLPPHRTAQTKKKRTETSMPQVGFEPKIAVFERALYRAATVMGTHCFAAPNWWLPFLSSCSSQQHNVCHRSSRQADTGTIVNINGGH
jgi:hypothetical protein